MARTFKKRGLRRDLNFADIPTPETALNNMLGNIAAQGQEGDRFISQDLDVLRGLRRTTMTRGDFLNIDGAAPTVINPNTGLEETYQPIISLQNRFDQARFTIGEPQFFGGNGLTTRYFEQVDTNTATATNVPAALSGIFDINDAVEFKDADGNTVDSEIFWEQGQYTFIGQLKDELGSDRGGIEWNGWFKPTRAGRWRFSVSTTGLFSFEFNTGANAVSGPGSVVHAKLRPVMPIGVTLINGSDQAFILPLSGAPSTQNGIATIRHLLRGDIIWSGADTSGSSDISQFNDTDNLITVSEIDVDDASGVGSFTLSSAFTGTGGSYTLYAVHPFGESGNFFETSGNLSAYTYYPITVRYMWANPSSGNPHSLLSNVTDLNVDNGGVYNFSAESSLVNSLSVNTTPPNSSSSYMNYKYLHDEDYERTPTGLDAGDFYNYYEDRVPPGGTRLFAGSDGSIGSTTESTYQNVFTKGQLVLPYEPPRDWEDIAYQKSLSWNQGSIILTTGNTDGIEVGNVVLAQGTNTGDPKFDYTAGVPVVTEISINEAVFVSLPIDSVHNSSDTSGSFTFTFLDHRGLKAIDLTGSTWTSNGTRVSNFSGPGTAIVNVGDVLVAYASQTNQYNVVTDIISGTEFDVSRALIDQSSLGQGASVDPVVAIYERSGLKNDSLDTYCNGVYGATTVGNASSGATQLTITSPTIYDGEPGAATLPSSGYYIFFGNRIPAGTTASVSGSTITLSNPISDDIPADQVVVLVSTNVNKDLCFPPTDTSPPFTATQNGLQTTSSRPTIEITGNDSEVKFIRLFVENGTVNTASANPAYDRKIPIKDLTGTTYNILVDAV